MSSNSKRKAVSFGETLFDVFGEYKKIGGAPLNLALRIKSFGFDVTMLSAVGQDQDGENLIQFMKENDVNTDAVCIHAQHETGHVLVSLNEKGSATYDITFPSAWDYITSNENTKKLITQADIFLFGSLASRNETSQNTLFELLESNPNMYKVFDINLRKPHYKIELLEKLMKKADFIKFNDEEILEIGEALGSESESIEENILFISKKTNTNSICVTLGKHGATMLWEGKIYKNNGYYIEVADTVGAGDSFLAGIISKLHGHEEIDPQKALDFACAVGAIVASNKGANPIVTTTDIQRLMQTPQHPNQEEI